MSASESGPSGRDPAGMVLLAVMAGLAGFFLGAHWQRSRQPATRPALAQPAGIPAELLRALVETQALYGGGTSPAPAGEAPVR